jgi:tetratricopeptide (TPR) repeat protein
VTFRAKIRIAVVALFAGLVVVPAHATQEQLEQAREKTAEAQKEQRAVGQAMSQGNRESAEQYQEDSNRHFRQAEDLYRQHLAESPRDVEALVEYADFLGLRGDADLAVETLRQATVIESESPRTLLALGKHLSTLGGKHCGEAERTLRRVTVLEPDSDNAAVAWGILGTHYWGLHLYDLSREAFDKARALRPDKPGALIGVIAQDVRDGKMKSAADALDALDQADPQLMSVADRFLQEALAEFDRTRRWFPDTAENHLAYAKLLARTGRYPESAFPLERAAKLDPGNIVTFNLLGSVYRGLNNPGRAREAFQRSLEINPDQPRTRDAINALAQPTEPAGETE